MDNLNFTNLTRHEIIAKYLTNLRELRDLAERNCNIRSLHFDNYVLFHYFQQQHSQPAEVDGTPNSASLALVKQILDRRRKIFFWVFYLALAFLCIAYKNEASTIILRHIQIIFYPGMKLWRKMTLPVIEKFPGLTELYDESCLFSNPFFEVVDLNCEPCSNVVNVLDLTNLNDNNIAEAVDKTTTSYVPFVFKIKQDPVKITDFYMLYKNNEDIFVNDAYRVRSTNREIVNLDELFNDFNQTHQVPSHSLWRCNRMPPARLLRQLFIRPSRLPNTGISLERYISIDTENAPSYAIPDAECSNMYIQQAYGTRTIILRSTVECRQKCRTVSVRLPQSFVLSYNWWYWKPISAPDPLDKSSSISLIGSYC